jgi:hypothetical protein
MWTLSRKRQAAAARPVVRGVDLRLGFRGHPSPTGMDHRRSTRRTPPHQRVPNKLRCEGRREQRRRSDAIVTVAGRQRNDRTGAAKRLHPGTPRTRRETHPVQSGAGHREDVSGDCCMCCGTHEICAGNGGIGLTWSALAGGVGSGRFMSRTIRIDAIAAAGEAQTDRSLVLGSRHGGRAAGGRGGA